MDTGGEIPSNEEWDNWLPNTPPYHPIRQETVLRQAERMYFEGLLQMIDAEIIRAAELTDVSHTASAEREPFRVHVIETDFEFATQPGESLAYVIKLEDALQSYNEFPVRTRDYGNRQVHSGWRGAGMCRVHTLELATGIKLKIYNKTDRRIRFEIAHRIGEARVRARDRSTSATLRKKCASVSAVMQLLEVLREDAAYWVNDALTHMREMMTMPVTSKTPLDFVYEFGSAVESPEAAKVLWDSLIARGSITSLATYADALARLRRRGILRTQPRNHRREHVVTREYQHPLHVLRSRPSGHAMTIRPRARIR